MNLTFAQPLLILRLKKLFAGLCLLLVCFNSFGQTRYTWKPAAGSSSWADGGNWNPARTIVATNDILVFDGALAKTVAVNVDFATSQAIGQLLFVNAVSATLSTGGDRTLNIGSPPSAAALQLETGTLVQIIGIQAGAGLTIQLVGAARATIAGRLEFLGPTSGSGSPHQLLSSTLGAVEFMSGSYFLAGPKFIGSPFGSAKPSTGSVVFHSGATCEQNSGTSPFGSKTYDVISLDPGSLFLYTSNNSNEVGVAGHTFGYLTLNTTRTSVTTTYSLDKVTIQNDLTIAGGAHSIEVGQCELKGNLVLNGGSLSLTPNAANTMVLTLNGTAAQNIGGSGSGTLALGPNVSLVMNNPAGVILQRPLQVKDLTLTNGLLTTTAANSLTLGPQATPPTGSATSFVNGPLSWVLATANTATDLFFPIGSGTAYRPFTLQVEQTDAIATTYTAQQFNQAPTVRAMPTAAGSLQRVSAVRYVNVTNNGAANFKQGAITLNYGNDDKVDAPAKLRIAKSDNAGNWLDLGGTGSGAPGGSIASTVAFTSFSDFVLASTEAAGGPGNNPLPVNLTGFAAQRCMAGVRLRWATATERNNKHFEVQRSTDGQAFAALKTVPGHGNSTAVQEYAWLDEAVEANGLVYYRLRQVDADNTATYSPVVAVQVGAAAAGVFPNPAYDRLNFHAAAGDAYRLLDMFGRTALLGKSVAGSNALNLSGLVPGIYHLEVIGAQGQVRYRVIKNGAGH